MRSSAVCDGPPITHNLPDSGLLSVRKVQIPILKGFAMVTSAAPPPRTRFSVATQVLHLRNGLLMDQRAEHSAENGIAVLPAKGGPRFRPPDTQNPCLSRARDRLKCCTSFHWK